MFIWLFSDFNLYIFVFIIIILNSKHFFIVYMYCNEYKINKLYLKLIDYSD